MINAGGNVRGIVLEEMSGEISRNKCPGEWPRGEENAIVFQDNRVRSM